MISINEINPYIRVAMHSVLNTGVTIKQRIIFDYELIYIEKGSFTFYYNGVRNKISEGQFIFIRPGIPHAFADINADLYQPHFHFDITYSPLSDKTPVSFKDLPQLTNDEKTLIQKDLFWEYPITPFVKFSNTTRIKKLFYGIIDAFTKKDCLTAKGKLTTLIAQLISDNFAGILSTEQTNTYSISRQIKDFIDSGQGIAFSLSDLEKQFSYSKFYLERQFKKEYGVSLISYQNDKKMRLAMKLLDTKTVTEVAEELGFSSIYSFSRAFKNKFGIPPSRHKK